MTTQTITIGKIDTVPERDPFQNMGGYASRTLFWLNLDDREAGVEQAYNDNSTSAHRWHGREKTARIDGHPHPDQVRAWIEENMDLLNEICDGYTCEWNGNNHVGRLSEQARQAWELLEWLLEGIPGDYYQFWEVGDWLYEGANERITPETTDLELATLAADFEAEAAIDNVILDGDVLTYLTNHRDQVRWEAEIARENE